MKMMWPEMEKICDAKISNIRCSILFLYRDFSLFCTKFQKSLPSEWVNVMHHHFFGNRTLWCQSINGWSKLLCLPSGWWHPTCFKPNHVREHVNFSEWWRANMEMRCWVTVLFNMKNFRLYCTSASKLLVNTKSSDVHRNSFLCTERAKNKFFFLKIIQKHSAEGKNSFRKCSYFEEKLFIAFLYTLLQSIAKKCSQAQISFYEIF